MQISSTDKAATILLTATTWMTLSLYLFLAIQLDTDSCNAPVNVMDLWLASEPVLLFLW